ncbi:Molybdopterin molybdenumtransferase 2 [Frankia sp. Hr75.2]|nr:Molybdopterin molybdenumtransferase 2 [Frankia sp. Hr75.2]
MKTVDQHASDIIAAIHPMSPRRTALREAHGCVLAAHVRATVAVPGFDNSAMDGYAARAADVAEASEDNPVTLPVAGEIMAGPVSPAPLAPGTVVRIMTGAPLPKGADTIVQLEWTDGGIETVRINQAPRRGLHIRRAGEDIAPGNLVLAAGTVLGAAQIGLLAAVNVARPAVHPRPRVAVLSTGSELVEVGTPLGPGQIVDSNSHAIAAAAHEAGALVRRVDGVSDDPDEFGATFDELLRSTDVLITTGGISVGARDVVKQVLSKSDEIRFERIAMQPGKPQGFGVVGGVPVFTLPGNPVSALVSFELFVRPALRRMRGLPAGPGGASWRQPATGTVTVRVSEAMQSAAGRRTFPRVRLERDDTGELVATSAGGQGAHQMSGLASAHALLVVPEEVTEVPAGTKLPAVLLPEPEWAGPFGEARG